MTRSAVAAVPLILVPALGAVQGGFHPDTWVWAGALAAWAGALVLALGGAAPLLRREWPWVALGLALPSWALCSTLWSVERSQSVLDARRDVVYAAVVLALVVLSRRRSTWVLVTGTQAAIAALVLYALGRYLLESRRSYPVEGYLLSQPLGYANAVGILAALGILLAIAPVAEARRKAVRAAAAATVPPLALALELTSSNASWLALALGAAALGLLHPRPGSLVHPALAVSLPAVVAVWLGHASLLADTTTTPRFGGGLVAAVAVALAATAAGAAAFVSAGRVVTAPRWGKPAAIAIAVAIGVGGAFVVLRAGAKEPRSLYYHVAWLEYRAHPLLGSGAGTFGRYWLRLGSPATYGGALDAHSLYLETLAELGPVGLLILCGFLTWPLRHAIGRRAIPGVPAAAGATVAFLVHSGLDWDWELPAVVVAALACTAAVALARPPDGTPEDEAAAVSERGRALAVSVALALGAAAIAGARSTAEPSAAARPTADTPPARTAPALRAQTAAP